MRKLLLLVVLGLVGVPLVLVGTAGSKRTATTTGGAGVHQPEQHHNE